MAAHDAWALVCRLFAGGTPVLRNMLPPREVAALPVLGKAVRPTITDQSFVLCPHCQQHRVQVWGDGRGGGLWRLPGRGPGPLGTGGGGGLGLGGGWWGWGGIGFGRGLAAPEDAPRARHRKPRWHR